jgi:HPt (histidine-containing phosphotransfer) domain-containing protein
MATLIDQDFFARLRALNDKFAAGVPDTVTRLALLRARFAAQAPDAAIVSELHQILHTVAGSAATFGFRTMGQQARALEQRLRVLMAFEVVGASDWEHWLDGLDTYLAWAATDPMSGAYPDDEAQQQLKQTGRNV